MVLFSIAPFFITTETGEDMVGDVYLWTAIASGALMLGLSVWVTVKPMETAAWTLFKFSSPYLAVLFIALMVDSAL
jgi:protoheme IX farnesyltransferase